MTLEDIRLSFMVKKLKDIETRVWKKYSKVISGDFLNWHEGLSPIEEKMWEKKFNKKQINETKK